MRLPTYDEIARDEKQLDVYETPFDESLFVVGPPGSGKTVLAVHRARMLADAGITVVLITYNRMLRRLIAQLTEDQIQAQTMHQFASARYLAQANVQAPTTAPYVYDWNAMFATLTQRGVTPNPTHVIVDEGQDLPPEFFRYLRDFVANTIMVFADEDQALTDERSTLLDIKERARFGDPVVLSANHRNTPETARVAEYFHAGDVPVPEVHRPRSGELPRVDLYRGAGASKRIANWYRTRGGRVGVAVVHNKPTGEALQSQLRNQLAGQRVDFYTSNMKNENDIDLLAPGITVLNVQSIKGQEFDTVFVMEIGELLRASEVNKRKMYMLCARARDNLFLMHEGDGLPRALLEQLPGAEILEQP